MFEKNDQITFRLLNKTEMDRLSRIEGEINWLEKMENRFRIKNPKQASYYRGTRSALQWALAYITAHQVLLIEGNN